LSTLQYNSGDEMNKKNIYIGIFLILIGAWFYAALSTFKTDDRSFPKKLVIEEGTVRTEDEVAEAISREMGFDLEGAYKTGYSPRDVSEYLIKYPHSLSITFYDGKYYEGRNTVPYFIPLSVCMFLFVIGIIMILSGLKSRKKQFKQ
jgi:hypothetical protein